MSPAEAGAYFARPFQPSRSVAALLAEEEADTVICRTCLRRVTVPGRFAVCPGCHELVFPKVPA